MSKMLFRDHLLEFAEHTLGSSFDSLGDKQRSVLMARFYAEQILRPNYPGLVPETEEDLEECLVDGSNDCGVDFLAKQENTVLIVQAKYSGGKKKGKKATEPFSDFDSFCNVLERLYAGPKRYQMNRKLREACVDIDWDLDNFSLHYITLRQVQSNAWTRAEQGVESIPDLIDLSERTNLELLDEENLNMGLRDALRKESEPTETVRVLLSPNADQPPYLTFDDPETGRKSVVARVAGSQVAELYQRYRSRLFTLNIRNYVGDTSTNKGIRNTAIENPTSFYYFNNGICAVATRIRQDPEDEKGRVILCDRFSIINGAQTVRSLAKAHAEDKDALRKVRVLLRIVEYGKLTSGEQSFLDNVIKFNNTQNSIKLSDFRSNDRVQVDLASLFWKLPARNGKKFRYRNKRTGEAGQKVISISMEEFTKAIYAFQFGPADVFGGTQHLFDTGKDGGYRKLFGDEGNGLTSQNFERLAGIWFICEHAGEIWKRLRKETANEALERRWLVYFAVGESLRLIYQKVGKSLERDLQLVCNPHLKAGSGKKYEHWRKVVGNHVNLFSVPALTKSYENAQKTSGFTHRNWFRDVRTLDAVRSELASFIGIAAVHPESYIFGGFSGSSE